MTLLVYKHEHLLYVLHFSLVYSCVCMCPVVLNTWGYNPNFLSWWNKNHDPSSMRIISMTLFNDLTGKRHREHPYNLIRYGKGAHNQFTVMEKRHWKMLGETKLLLQWQGELLKITKTRGIIIIYITWVSTLSISGQGRLAPEGQVVTWTNGPLQSDTPHRVFAWRCHPLHEEEGSGGY